MAEPFETYLSHYTNLAGLEGIADSKSLWATNFLDLPDTCEYLYAWSILTRDAMEMAIERVPAKHRRPGFDLNSDSKTFSEHLKRLFANSDGYDNLYVTSFARARTEDQHDRGILCLWREYAKHDGYCLQFERRQIELFAQLEATRASYTLCTVRDVQYGIDKTAEWYQMLRYQMAQSALLQMARSRRDLRIEPDLDEMWPDSRLAAELSLFCATHKDPCFEDEREVRIVAYPSAQAQANILTGLATRKKIHINPKGRRYLALGEHWRPGIEPKRIILGQKATRDIAAVEAMFKWPPVVVTAALPIA